MTMKTNSDFTVKLQSIVKVFIEKKKYKPALEDLKKLEEEYHDNMELQYYMGLCYSNIHAYDSALPYLNSIRGSKELSVIQQIQVHMLIGYIYTEKKDFFAAEKAFKDALKINPNSSMSYSALGYVYYLMKKYDFAIMNFKKALEEDPNNAGAHNNLGYTYAEIGINVNEAIRECKKAVMFNPDSPAYRDSLGWAYYAANQYTESLKELKKALELCDGNNETINEHLNLVMKKTNQKHA